MGVSRSREWGDCKLKDSTVLSGSVRNSVSICISSGDTSMRLSGGGSYFYGKRPARSSSIGRSDGAPFAPPPETAWVDRRTATGLTRYRYATSKDPRHSHRRWGMGVPFPNHRRCRPVEISAEVPVIRPFFDQEHHRNGTHPPRLPGDRSFGCSRGLPPAHISDIAVRRLRLPNPYIRMSDSKPRGSRPETFSYQRIPNKGEILGMA